MDGKKVYRSSGSRSVRGSSRASHRRRRLLCLLLFLLVLCGFLVMRAPLTRLAEWEGRLREAERRLEEERAVTRSLEERLSAAREPYHLELRARELGYVRPGEVPLVVEERKR